MEANLSKVINMRISNTIEALKKNNMNALYVPGKEEAKALLGTLLVENESIAVGGSVTLNEIGAFDILRSGKYNFIDRYEKGLSAEEQEKRFAMAMSCDTFLCSSNAITETGCLYNVDGRGNRISSIIYGPKRVIIIAGYNKIVPDVAAAVVRVKKTAAPANCVRLDVDTYCAKHGSCIKSDCNCRNLMEVSGTDCENTICCSTLVSGCQRVKDRITVILVGEMLGY